MTFPATNAFSVNNLTRATGETTEAAIYAAWLAHSQARNPDRSDLWPTLAMVQEGIAFLVANSFATFNGTTVTYTTLDANGRPHRLRRVPGSGDTELELLPPGAPPQSV
jgi:hypothetical protein